MINTPLPPLNGDTDPYAEERQSVLAAKDQVQQELAALRFTYREQVSQSVIDYVLGEVRQTCTQKHAVTFLQLPAETQAEMIQLAMQLAQELRQRLQSISLTGAAQPWQELEVLLSSPLVLVEQQLDRLYELMGLIAAQDPNPRPITPLRWLGLEIRDPRLRSLRSQYQVLAARYARLESQEKNLAEKQAIYSAQIRWQDLLTTLHSGMTPSPVS
ncbi:MAG: hypothetical protein NW237_06635 [Cyanobacteriota bacterium]|nr:hypothetical protein [Cyanobacteriota bacterium]